MGRLDGKIAIITGATGGIGSATARKFLDEGASVMLAGRDAGRLAEAAAALGESDRVATSAGHPAEEADVAALVAATIARFGRLDILVANAGS